MTHSDHPPAVADTAPERDPRVLDELLADGSMVLYHTASRKLMTLNPTAALVWEYCDGQHSLEQITDEVRAVFPAAPTIADDVVNVLNDLRAREMLRLPQATS
jgi:hypothetical protein